MSVDEEYILIQKKTIPIQYLVIIVYQIQQTQKELGL